MTFENSKHNEISFLTCSELNALGLKHGFADKSCDMRISVRNQTTQFFEKQFGIQRLHTLEQVHGKDFMFYDQNSSWSGQKKSDAIIVENYKKRRNEAFGVLSADCLPIILVLGQSLAVVHSGWRGLAVGILPTVINRMLELNKDNTLYVAVGPAAGPERYEVGEDVIKGIGVNAVYEKISQEKYLISLALTAKKIISTCFTGEIKFFASEICVISNTDYFSYRREGENAGRNLTFVIL